MTRRHSARQGLAETNSKLGKENIRNLIRRGQQSWLATGNCCYVQRPEPAETA